MDEPKDLFVRLSGSYERSAGNTMKYEVTEKVTVLPPEKVIDMEPSIVVDGRSANVTLNVRSVAPYRLSSVSLIDMLPKGFSMSAGQRDRDLEQMDVGDELEAYSYIVDVPATFTGDTFVITHIFNAYDDKDEALMFEKKSTVVLSGAAPTEDTDSDIEDSGSADNETTGDVDETPEEQVLDDVEDKPGVFTRMWRWITGLFSGDKEEDSFE